MRKISIFEYSNSTSLCAVNEYTIKFYNNYARSCVLMKSLLIKDEQLKRHNILLEAQYDSLEKI
jgi:hypothetical protein